MFQYMASGRPIVCNINIPQCPITSNQIGIAHEMGNEWDYANAIRSILKLSPSEYFDMCERAKEVAKTYDYEYLTNKMIEVINYLDKK